MEEDIKKDTAARCVFLFCHESRSQEKLHWESCGFTSWLFMMACTASRM